MNKILIFIVILVFLSFNAALALTFRHEPLTIKTASGKEHLSAEIAETPEQQQLGLMYRTHLPEDYGMLFVLQQDTDAAMWMKNTKLPLDMLFIDKRGTIVYIAANTTPESTAVIRAKKPVHAVLELKGGEAAHRHIRVGDRVMSHYFTP